MRILNWRTKKQQYSAYKNMSLKRQEKLGTCKTLWEERMACCLTESISTVGIRLQGLHVQAYRIIKQRYCSPYTEEAELLVSRKSPIASSSVRNQRPVAHTDTCYRSGFCRHSRSIPFPTQLNIYETLLCLIISCSISVVVFSFAQLS